MNIRRVRLGLGVSLFVATAAIASLTSPPAGAQPSGTATPLAVPGTPAPNVQKLNGNQPTPFPLNTLAPLTGETSLPYPAYGTPVPGVNSGTPAPGISATISLNDAEMVGFARSPSLATARNDVAVQAALVRLQRAGLLPSLTGNATYEYDHTQPSGDGETIATTTTGTGTTGTTGTSSTGFTQQTSATSAGFNIELRQLIYDGGKLASAVHAATSQEASTADTYRRELQTVAYNVATNYYAYLAAERTVQVDLEIVREDLVQEDLVRAQVRAGTAARSDIATTELPVAQARLAVVRAQGSELSAEAAFVNSMGLDANSKVQPIDDAPVFTANQVSSIPVPSYDVALKRAIALRPDYDSALQIVISDKYSLRSAKLGLFPTLSATGAAQDNSTDSNAGSFRNAQSIGLALSIPIYDQGVTAANVAESNANLNNAYASLQNTTLTVQLNIKQSLTNLVSSRAALDQTQQEYATALVNVQATQAQYRAGVTTLPLLLNAQVQLTQALTDQVTAVYTLRQGEQSYLYAVGANYDTSANNGKTSISPVPGPESQGGNVAVKPKPSASKVASGKSSGRTVASKSRTTVSAQAKKNAGGGGTVSPADVLPEMALLEPSVSVEDPVNAAILKISEDRIAGFLRDPLGEIARQSGVDLNTVIARIRAMLASGTIRRVRQTLLATNLAHGALVAWQIPADKLDAAFEYMSNVDPFSGHVVIRTTDAATPGSNYRLWTTLKVPQGYAIEKHAEFLREKVGAEAFRLMPAERLFALGVGHIRRRGLEPGSRADVPADVLDTTIVDLSPLDWQVLVALKREFEIHELVPDIWKARAQEADVDLATFYRVAESLAERGVIGRFSTFLEHVKAKAGGERVTRYNALFHWRVPVGREIEAGREVGRHHIMTHAYWREGGEEFRGVNVMGVAHGLDKDVLLAHKAAIDEHLREAGIDLSYTNVFWGGRSEIKPSEISPYAFAEFHRRQGTDPDTLRA